MGCTLGLLLSTLVMIGLPAPAWAQAATPPEFSQEGMETQVARKLALLSRAVEARPRNAALWGKLGENFFIHELRSEAAVCFKQAGTLDPNAFRWPYLCGITLDKLGDPEALHWYQRAVQLDPNNPFLRVRMGNFYLMEAAPTDAARHFTEAIRLDTKSADAHLGLAQIDYNEGKFAEAAARLRRAIAIEPRLREAYALLVSCYRMLNDREKVAYYSSRLGSLPEARRPAEPILRELEREGVSFQWYVERARGHQAARRLKPAIMEYQKALQIRRTPSALAGLGVALLDTGDLDGAIASFREAHSLNPESAQYSLNLGATLCQKGLTDEGIPMLVEAVRLAPENHLFATVLMVQYTGAGRWSEALAFGTRRYAASPEYYRMGLDVAWMLATCPQDDIRDGARALEIAKPIVERTKGRHLDALDTLAAAYAEQGQFDLARDTMDQAIEIALGARKQDKAAEYRERRDRYLQKRPWRSE